LTHEGECESIANSDYHRQQWGIGSAFIDHVGEHYRETAFDHEGQPHPPPKTDHVIDCDLRSDERVRTALDEVCRRRLGHRRIELVIHLPAYYSFPGEPINSLSHFMRSAKPDSHEHQLDRYFERSRE
jgi:hypothetical protein